MLWCAGRRFIHPKTISMGSSAMKAKKMAAGGMSKKGSACSAGGMAKKGYADGGAVKIGGKVRGAGCAIKGTRPAKMM